MGGSKQESKTETNNYPSDPEAARRMAGVAERSQALAEEQFSLAKSVYEPYERLVMSEGMRDLEQGRELKDLTREQLMSEMRFSAPAVEAFYKEATTPVNIAEREAEAEADVVSEYANVPESVRRGLSRTGVRLSGARQQNLMKAIALDRARSISGARATARQASRDETFAKLKTAMAARSGINETPYNTAATEGGFTVKSAADRAAGLYANAINANEAGMRPLTQSKGSSSGLSLSFG
jgi:hypothetical protein